MRHFGSESDSLRLWRLGNTSCFTGRENGIPSRWPQRRRCGEWWDYRSFMWLVASIFGYTFQIFSDIWISYCSHVGMIHQNALASISFSFFFHLTAGSDSQLLGCLGSAGAALDFAHPCQLLPGLVFGLASSFVGRGAFRKKLWQTWWTWHFFSKRTCFNEFFMEAPKAAQGVAAIEANFFAYMCAPS